MKKKILAFINICFLSFFACAQDSKTFTLAVIPDTQGYSYYKYQTTAKNPFPVDCAGIWYSQMKYIANNSVKNGGFIAYAIHLGDLVSSRSEHIEEWEIADKAMSILDGVVPFSVVPGNHDYDRQVFDSSGKKAVGIDGNETFTRYFGAESKFFKDKEYYKSNFNNGMNSFSTFIACGEEFGVLGMEYNPDDEALEWAQEILDQNKNMPIIFVTHAYLDTVYDVYNPGMAAFHYNPLRKHAGGNISKDIWKKLISKNKQIFLVLSGHCYLKDEGESCRTDVNDAGYKVYSMLSDFEGRCELLPKSIAKDRGIGDGWMRLLNFDLDKKQIDVRTYSTAFNKYEEDRNSKFTIKFDWDWNERFLSEN